MSIESYARLWSKPFYYVLGPLPSYEKALAAQGVRYYPYTWIGTAYVIFVVEEDELVPQVIQNMLDAGVPILDPLPSESEEEALEHFWTDRLQEFVLIATPPHSNVTHSVYQLDPPGYVVMFLTLSVYQDMINRMLAAGAKVLSEPPK